MLFQGGKQFNQSNQSITFLDVRQDARLLAALHLRGAELQHRGQNRQQRRRLPGLVQLQDAAQQHTGSRVLGRGHNNGRTAQRWARP